MNGKRAAGGGMAAGGTFGRWWDGVAVALGLRRGRPVTAQRLVWGLTGEAKVKGKPARDVVLALHGILTGGARVNWTERFEAWAIDELPGHVVLTQNYFRLALPRWNWVPNWFRARKLARWVGPLIEDGFRLHVVSHSNGASIALALMKRLARDGMRVESALFIGGAISCDIERSGIKKLVADGWLGRACAWWSERDGVIGMPAILLWPYGRLGARGFRQRLRGEDGRRRDVSGDGEFLTSVKHAGFAHGGYWEREHEVESFEGISRWVRGVGPAGVSAARAAALTGERKDVRGRLAGIAALIMAAAVCGGCTTMAGMKTEAHGEKPAREVWVYSSIGGDAEGLAIAASAASAAKINNSKTAMSGIRTWGTVTGLDIVTSGGVANTRILEENATARVVAGEKTKAALAGEATKRAALEAAAKAAGQ